MRILIQCNLDAFFPSLYELGRALLRSREFEPVFLFDRYYPTRAKHIATALQSGCRCLNEDGSILSVPPDSLVSTDSSEVVRRPASMWKRMIKGTGLVSFVRLILDSWRHLRRIRQRVLITRRIIRAENVSLIVMGADLPGYDTSAVIHGGHAENVPTLIVASFVDAHNTTAEALFHEPSHGMGFWPNRLVAFLFPRWTTKCRGETLVRAPAAEVVALEWLNLAPRTPWLMHSGEADAIAVEGGVARRKAIVAGLPAEKLVCTGLPAHDVLAETIASIDDRRAELLRRLGLPPKRFLILTALPPNLFYQNRSESEFATYEELLSFWFGTISECSDCNSLVSLHPSVTAADASALRLERWGAIVAPEKTAQIVPLCDIFIANLSSTIHWALACGKPTIDYDFDRYGKGDFDGAAGVISVQAKANFRDMFRRLTTDQDFLADVKARTEAQAADWGRLDAKACERIIDVMKNLIAKRHHNGEISKEGTLNCNPMSKLEVL